MVSRVLSGGERLQAKLAEIAQRLGRGGTLSVGFLSGSAYPDGTPTAMIAAIQEFGAPRAGIPPRPFMRDMIAEHSSEWPDEIEAQLKSTNYDTAQTMNRMGILIRGQIQQSIRDFDRVPLKPATIARKGFDKQLIDTSHMLNSVAFEYEEK